MTGWGLREEMDFGVYKPRISRICQVRLDRFVGTSNPQVAGSIPAGGAIRVSGLSSSVFEDFLVN